MRQTDNIPAQNRLGDLLRGSGLSVGAAESCTGGNISHLITLVPGASEYYAGSVTSYAVRIKNKLLGVLPEVVETCGIVSEAVAVSMAEGVRRQLEVTFSVATTGWADNYGDEHEPAGTCWVAVSGPAGTRARKITSHRSRKANITRFSNSALEMLTDYIAEYLND